MTRPRAKDELRDRAATPYASSPEALRRMQSVRQAGTGPELALRRELFRRGFRYRVQVRLAEMPRRTIDLVFIRARVAVFIDGCFWHGCPEHGTWPKANADFWRGKILANVARDRETDQQLKEAGWSVVRVWEHEDPVAAADRIVARLACADEEAKQV